MKTIINWSLQTIYIPVLLLLPLAYISVYISPEKIWWMPFFGLIYPISLFLNILFLTLLVLRERWKTALISLTLILLGWTHLSNIFQFSSSSKDETNSGDNLKLMTYNVRLFDLYNWSHNKETRDNIFSFINDEEPDLICFQEFYKDDSKEFSTIDTLTTFQKAKYFHTAYTKTLYDIYHYGIATLSAYPITNKGEIRFENSNNICIYTDIDFKGDTIRIYNNHLQSVHFHNDNYNFIDSIAFKSKEEKINGVKNIFTKLSSAYKKRAKQVDMISDHIKNSPYPVIVCGDFNDTPVSYTYQKMKGELLDSFKESGKGFGDTYAGNLPPVRIDFIFHCRELRSSNFRIPKVKFSDHYPLISTFQKPL